MRKRELKPGITVRIKENFDKIAPSHDLDVLEEMLEYKNEEFCVESVDEDYDVSFEIYFWNYKWLEKV